MRLLRFVLSTLCIFVAPSVVAQLPSSANVATNVLASTLMIRTAAGQGTGFTVDVDGRQYLITAKHMVTGMGDQGVIEIAKFKNNEIAFDSLTMKIFRCADPIDIAVLVPPVRLVVLAESMDPIGSGNFIIGQNVYFVGFPSGKHSTAKQNSDSYGPIGFVKQAIISGVEYVPAADGDLIFLDGFNIGGFSGSPVTYWVQGHSYVIGVISGFDPDYGPVLMPKEVKPEDVKPEDKIVHLNGHPGVLYKLVEKEENGKKTNEGVILNRGIAHSYGIKPAIDLIKLHPIGPVTKAK